ncbi:archaea-specific SMC-related protein [Haloarchaeobius sp. HME9146]|uniref:archaea-specific SMC-related protein n=1 Tax=Haloarchaeobius sp. HME9146 TaxID=2978732 RepID=UPI0021BF84B2|nr:archaea-specific SMC-related protein [Haloarchaeobius sp. HME9146]MCT9098424.1 chromosome segregation protein SMC [Haloarchaeobius sp. HME9146]
MTSRLRETPVSVEAENVGGIDETTVELDAGVTVLAGRNATNRTSFLQALMAGLGSERVSLKGDAEAGRVELQTPDGTYTRTLERGPEGVRFGGTPLLDDPEVADLFAFLLEDNPARQAVERGDDLWELVMRPVDTDAIEAEATRLEAQKEELDRQLDELGAAKERLPDLEQRRNAVDADIEETEAELESVEAELESAEGNLADETVDDVLGDLNEVRGDLEDVRFQLDSERESASSLEAEQQELREELESLPEQPAARLDELEGDLERYRERKRRLDSVTNTLQNLLSFNREMLDGEHAELFERLASAESGDGGETDSGAAGTSVPDALAPDEALCWTCGTTVETDQLDGMVDRLQAAYQDARAERSTVVSELDDVQSEKRAVERKQARREALRQDIEAIEAELVERRRRIEDLERQRAELEAEVESLEAAVEERRATDEDELVALHERANDLEFELGRLHERRADLTDQIAELESELERETDLRERREQVAADLEAQRTRIDRLEADVVESFNDHMAELLDILGYENVERIWIERKREDGTDVTRSSFDLHVIRSDETGASYEDSVMHLSESERTVTGLTFALAGYLAHEVYETVPVVLLDSLEAVDAERIAAVVEYFESYADYLVVALLHEDAAALPDEYRRVTEI